LRKSSNERLLQSFLSQIKIVEEPDKRSQNSSRLLAINLIYRHSAKSVVSEALT
jgi:hypothetical protein